MGRSVLLLALAATAVHSLPQQQVYYTNQVAAAYNGDANLKALLAESDAVIKKYENKDFPYPADLIQGYRNNVSPIVASGYTYSPEATRQTLQQLQAETSATLNRLAAESAAVQEKYAFRQKRQAVTADYTYVPTDTVALLQKYQNDNAATIEKFRDYKYDPNTAPAYNFQYSNPIPVRSDVPPQEIYNTFINTIQQQGDLLKTVFRLSSGELFGAKKADAAGGCDAEALTAATDNLVASLTQAGPEINNLLATAQAAQRSALPGNNANTIRASAVAFDQISGLVPRITDALTIQGKCGATDAASGLAAAADLGKNNAEINDELKKSIDLTRTITRIAASASGAKLTTLCSDDPNFTDSVLSGADELLSTFGDLFADFNDPNSAAQLKQSAAAVRNAAAGAAYNGQPTCETSLPTVSAILKDIADLEDQKVVQGYAAVPVVAAGYAPAPVVAAGYAPVAYTY